MKAETIRFTAAACGLAQTIYYARVQAFALEHQKHWEALPSTTKQLYIEHAQAVLNNLQPVKEESPLFVAFAGLTRAHAAKVTHRITPEAPYGEEITR